MKYLIEKASEEDIKRILDIYAFARAFMEAHGNPTQWGKAYPDKGMVRSDILQGKLYTVRKADGIHGVFYFAQEQDPAYDEIFDGTWHSNMPYGVIHRIAGDGSGGILKAAVNYVGQFISYLRIDTHDDNYVMKNALINMGFQKCGKIFIEDGTPRIAYDRMESGQKHNI